MIHFQNRAIYTMNEGCWNHIIFFPNGKKEERSGAWVFLESNSTASWPERIPLRQRWRLGFESREAFAGGLVNTYKGGD
jgi:hypothetical protein